MIYQERGLKAKVVRCNSLAIGTECGVRGHCFAPSVYHLPWQNFKVNVRARAAPQLSACNPEGHFHISLPASPVLSVSTKLDFTSFPRYTRTSLVSHKMFLPQPRICSLPSSSVKISALSEAQSQGPSQRPDLHEDEEVASSQTWLCLSTLSYCFVHTSLPALTVFCTVF